ncbi:inner membrane protein import complex subunit Tim54-domain-containing protein [Melampsora americana]|nr:inner membrane protein import complex subunit Tim54-domain-containing protein [Melampsora americana]
MSSATNPAFRYLGIPQSWLKASWKPRLPSPKTSGFILVSSSLLSLYLYDRHQCRRLREEYVHELQHLSQAIALNTPSAASWMPRRITVYGARVPNDVDVDRGAQWFKKYVKPMLIAAAIDYRIENGISPGALGRKISSDIHNERIIQAAQNREAFHQPPVSPGMPGFQMWHFQQHRLEGANLILGRASLKEYLWGLKKGYREPLPLDGLEEDERLSRQLDDEGLFDQTDHSDESLPEGLRGVTQQIRMTDDSLSALTPSDLDTSPKPNRNSSWIPNLTPFSPSNLATQSSTLSTSATNQLAVLPPSPIPEQPPLLLVPFDHPIGMIWWPLKLYRFFNRRHDVKKGAEVVKSLIAGQSTPITPPTDLSGLNQYCGWLSADQDDDTVPTDFSIKMTGSPHLDFLCPEAEKHVRRSYKKAFRNVTEERTLYREQLKERLAEARKTQLDTDDAELKNNSSVPDGLTEVRLRQEALSKEKKWRNDLEGWKILRPGSGVCWDDDMAQSLRVYEV